MKKLSFYTIWLVLFGLLLLVPLVDLLHPGLPVTHDGQDHVARIANFYQSLQEGVIVPRWAGNLNWGYGHPILMFLYPMPSYFASVFHFIGFSFVDSVKLVFGISFVLSGLTMYLWLREEFGEFAGIAGGLLYTYAPYRFVDLYVRGAIGEHVAFIFPPLILFFLMKISQRFSIWYIAGGGLSLAGLILSHNAISLMFLPILVLYMTYRTYESYKAHKKKVNMQILSYASIVLLGFGLAAFFWVPAFFEGKYTLRDIVTAGGITSRFVPWGDFFYGEWSYGGTDYLSKQIGLVQWGIVAGGVISLIVLKKKQKRHTLFLSSVLILFFCSLFIMTSASSFIWQHVSLLSKFQFPWRFLSVSVFFAAVLGALVFSHVPKKRQPVILAIMMLLLLMTTFSFWKAKSFLQKPEQFYSGIYNSTTDTGESSPIWSVRFMEKRPDSHMEVIEGKAQIIEQQRSSVLHQYKVVAQTKVRLRENTLYFPGWQVSIDGSEVGVNDLEFQDPLHRGVMTFFVEPGSHTVSLQFAETKLRMIANVISLGCLSILVVSLILKSTLWRRFR